VICLATESSPIALINGAFDLFLSGSLGIGGFPDFKG